MRKINGVISGMASLFSDTSSDVLEKYPSTYEKDVRKSLQSAWDNVGTAIKGAMEKYDKAEETFK